MTGRALVTGAGGFLGRHVVAELARRDYQITRLRFAFDANGSDLRIRTNDGAHPVAALDDLIARADPTVIFHLAGTSRPSLMTEVNVGLALRLVGALRRTSLGSRLVLIGSSAEYGRVEDDVGPVAETYPCRPLTAYGATKHAQTLIGLEAAAEGIDVVVARCFNLVGAGMPADAPLMEIASRLGVWSPSATVPVGDLDIERDFLDADEAARCLIGLAGDPRARGQLVNVCSGQGTLLRDAVQALVEAVSPRPTLVPDPSLMRGEPIRRMVGDPGRLNALGLSVSPPDFALLAGMILRDASKPL
jgi:GDP-4-dehydro-6-deoxy-D-mannose reductase